MKKQLNIHGCCMDFLNISLIGLFDLDERLLLILNTGTLCKLIIDKKFKYSTQHITFITHLQ